MKKPVLLVACLFFFAAPLWAQPTPQRPINVVVAPDHSDWIYRPGEVVKFNGLPFCKTVTLNFTTSPGR